MGLSAANTFPLPRRRQKAIFYTGSIETETLIPHPQPSINPNPAVSQGTSPQYCAEYQPAAPTEIQHSLDELLHTNSRP